MSCSQISDLMSKFGHNCLESLGLKRKTRKVIDISAPFNFKEGPAVNFPGYSEDDISLMREKAIASTAVVEDGDFDRTSRMQRPRSGASSNGCGLGSKVVYHARKVSKGYLY